MRLLITTQVYPPEIHPTAVMVRELAEFLASRGWDVQVCAGWPHHPYGRLYDGYVRRLRKTECNAGVQVVRTWHIVHPSRSIPVRGAVFASQALGNAVAALTARPPDVVLTYGPPLAGPLLGALVAHARRARLVNVVYDIYPDVAIETGKIRHPAAIAAARLAERLQYRLSHRTIVLSEGFRQTMVRKGLPPDTIRVVPVWLDPDEIRPGPRLNRWRTEQRIPPDVKVVLYAGTIGLVSGAEIVVEVARRFRARPDILFLFVGEGAVKDEVQRRAVETGLHNLRFLPFQPRERLPEVQATADIGLVTLAAGRGRTSVPSKVVGYMAAGRPIIASVDLDSDTAHEVRTADAGTAVPPGEPAALAAALERMIEDQERLHRLGANARRHFERTYARDAVLAQYEKALSEW